MHILITYIYLFTMFVPMNMKWMPGKSHRHIIVFELRMYTVSQRHV